MSNTIKQVLGTQVIFRYQFLDSGEAIDLTSRTVTVATFKQYSNTNVTAVTVAKVAGTDGYVDITCANTVTAGQYEVVLYLDGGEFDTLDLICSSREFSLTSCVYTTPEKIVSLLRLQNQNNNRLVLSEFTDPKLSEVVTLITWAQDYIDKMTNKAWRTTTVTDELRSIPFPFSGIYPKYFKIPLRHMHVSSIDALHIHSVYGTSDDDWKVTHVEGRGRDWWLDKTKGHVYIRMYAPYFVGENSVRVSYKYGETVVPKDIEEACTKLVAVKLLEMDYGRTMLSEGVSLDPSKGSVINQWKKDADLILRRRMKYVTVGTI